MWGIEVLIDLEGCDPAMIRDDNLIRTYVNRLIRVIDMKPYGETILENFGSCIDVEGFTMIQMIETSLISGHFVNVTNNAYINIFSCKFFDAEHAALFTKEYFRADKMVYHRLTRGR